MSNANDTFLKLLDRELRTAWEHWTMFALTRSPEAWRAYSAAYRRAKIVAVSLGIDFPMPKPVLRVKADTATNKRAA